MSRLVSVAIATYNGEPYLRQQLDSIYAQSVDALEIVVSDDRSNDGTTAILDEYTRSRGLRYSVAPQRLGLVKNFERAISLCRGDVIALSDQDDVWSPNKLERLLPSLHDADLAYCSTEAHVDEAGHAFVLPDSVHTTRFANALGSGKPTRYFLAENWVVGHSMCFRSSLCKTALPIPAGQRFHDAWLALVASTGRGVQFVNEKLQTYRQHSQSLTFRGPRAERTRAVRSRMALRQHWSERSQSETERLGDAMGLASLSSDDRAFCQDLLLYYRSGLEPGYRWRSFRAGIRVARYFSTQYRRSPWRLAIKPLIAGR